MSGRIGAPENKKDGGSVSVPSGGCGFEYSQEGFPKKWAFKQRLIIVINIRVSLQ